MVKQIRKFWAIVLSVIACSCTEKEPEIIHVSSILLNPTSISITEGQTTTISATISPSNASNQKVIWSSSDASVATVNDGVVVAIKSGNATITAKAEDKIATCDISVYPATGAISLDATHITCRSAELSGKVNFSQGSTDMVFGILYSTSSGVLYGKSENLEATVFDSNYNFSLLANVLEPETTYYYRSYLSQKGEIIYGEVKSFTTLPVSSLIQTGDATDIYPKGATLSATLDFSECRYDNIEYGFYVFYIYNGKKFGVFYEANNLTDKNYSHIYHYPIVEREYFYMAYVKLDENTYYGEEKSFTSTTSFGASITADMTEIEYRSAVIYGKLALEHMEEYSLSVKLYYSYKEDVNTIDELKSMGKEIVLTLDEDGNYMYKLNGLKHNTQYKYVVVAEVKYADVEFTAEGVFLTKEKVVEAVDLGLSVKWADCNVGALFPDEIGFYYAWGEIERTTSNIDKGYKYWSDYKWSYGAYNKLTKYCTSSDYGIVDNKKSLEPEDDVAHVKLGGTWRMPTSDELWELKDNCSWYWTDNYNGTSAYGYIVKSERTGKHIFISVNRKAKEIYGLWSSSGWDSHATCIYFKNFDDNDRSISMLSDYRNHLLYVRAVTE